MSRRPSTRVMNAVGVRESETAAVIPRGLKNSVSCVKARFSKRHRFGTRCSVFSAQLTRRSVVRASAKEGSRFAWIPRSFRELHPGMPDSRVKPGNQNTVEKQRHRRGAGNGQRQAIGRVFQAEQLFAVFESALDGPTTGIGETGFAARPRRGGCSRTFGPAGRLGDRASGRSSTNASRPLCKPRACCVLTASLACRPN